MRTQKYLIGLLLVALFTITINLNAAVTAEKVWDQASLSVTPDEQVSFVQYRINTDTAVNLEKVVVKSVGLARLVFSKIVIRNGFGRVIGEAKPNENDNLTSVPLERMVVLPDMTPFITIQGETASSFASGVAGQSAGLVGVWLFTSEGIIPLAESRTIYTALGSFRTLTSLVVTKIGSSSEIRVGERRFLGGFFIRSINGNLGTQLSINLHVFRGMKEDVQNLVAIALNANGNWYFVPIEKRQEYGDILSNYSFGGNLEFSDGVTLIGIFADVGQSFGGGGTIAVSTTPSQWQTWDTSTGRTPVLSDKTVVGPTIRVAPIQRDGGKG